MWGRVKTQHFVETMETALNSVFRFEKRRHNRFARIDRRTNETAINSVLWTLSDRWWWLKAYRSLVDYRCIMHVSLCEVICRAHDIDSWLCVCVCAGGAWRAPEFATIHTYAYVHACRYDPNQLYADDLDSDLRSASIRAVIHRVCEQLH